VTSIEISVVRGRRCRVGDVMTDLEYDDTEQVILELERADKLLTTLRSIFEDPNYREGVRDHVRALLEGW
jgi:hypothetical protein